MNLPKYPTETPLLSAYLGEPGRNNSIDKTVLIPKFENSR